MHHDIILMSFIGQANKTGQEHNKTYEQNTDKGKQDKNTRQNTRQGQEQDRLNTWTRYNKRQDQDKIHLYHYYYHERIQLLLL